MSELYFKPKMSDKQSLRDVMLEKRLHMAPRFKRNFDYEVCEALKKITLERDAKVIHAYLPIKGEINITPYLRWLLQMGLRVVCPKVLPGRRLQNLELLDIEKLEKGPFNTIHPAGENKYEGRIDLVIIPGLAFDRELNRLGYGGGYYDRFLPNYSEAYKLAVQYPFQLVPSVPTEAHDVKVDQLILCNLDK